MPLDEETLSELREDLGEDFAPFVYRFLDGARAAMGRMRAALEAGDAGSLGAEAHALKGTAGYLGADELTASLAALQQAA